MSSSASFLDGLTQLPLLEAGQRSQLAALQQQFPDAKALARELIDRGWLTQFQAKQLAAGKGRELVLDQYVLLDLLGQGGMGAVFKARQMRMNRLVAVKVIRPEHVKSGNATKRFKREAEATSRLCHPNVVLVHDTNEVRGLCFLVMEYLEGTDLAKLVRQQGPLPIPQACDYIRQAALGLQHAHEKGLVHRDIKPHNLMLTREGVVKVMDMGLARMTTNEGDPGGDLTKTGTLMGTADYLAPEQALNAKTVDIRADIYSLGCTFYHLLAGQPPFAGAPMVAKIASHVTTEPTPVEEHRPEVPLEIGEILRRMMAKQPEQRYQTPNEVALALEPYAPKSPTRAIDALPTEPVRAGTADTINSPRAGYTQAADLHPSSRLRGLWAALLILLTVLACAALGWGLMQLLAPPSGATGTAGATKDTGAAALPPLDLDLGNGVKLELLPIRAGTFLMGSPDADEAAPDDEKPAHEVAISKDFYLGKYPVTQEQYEQVMGANPSGFAARGLFKDKVAGLDTRRFPVEMVSWTDAEAFCKRAGEKTKRRVELPREAEWEYACRAGTRTRYYCGDKLTDRDANFERQLGRPSEVGKYPANPWGLFDMAGNVWQWCADGKRRYTAARQTDPVGPLEASRVLRGGGWQSTPRDCRSAASTWFGVSYRQEGVGFRVVVRTD